MKNENLFCTDCKFYMQPRKPNKRDEWFAKHKDTLACPKCGSENYCFVRKLTTERKKWIISALIILGILLFTVLITEICSRL